VDNERNFDYIYHSNGKWADVVQDNLRFDCNDIEIKNNAINTGKTIYSQVIAARNAALDDNRTDREATNSSARDNVIHGGGGVKFFYWFGPGYRSTGGIFDTSGNTWDIGYTSREYK